jgi:hypothetical protein
MTTRPSEVFERRMLARGLRFVLVNERSPRVEAACTVCCTRIDRGYVRDPMTRLLYCDTKCFTDHEQMSNPARARDTRRAS